MSKLVFGGSFDEALTHFAGLGVAAILEDRGYRDLRLNWSEEATPRLALDVPSVEDEQVAEEVREHAVRHAEAQSWVQQTTVVGTGKKDSEVGLFSPRIATPGTGGDWRKLYDQRRAIVDLSANSSWLDYVMLQSLGEPAYWQFEFKDPRYDEGASRWEMKTRNRGEDFTRNRLALLARSVGGRSPGAILAGLTGQTVADSKGGPDSRTGTGLVPPGSVDDAVGWCGLWGLSAFPLCQRLTGVAVTPGALPVDRFHTETMVLPMSTEPMSPARMRMVLRSRSFEVASMHKVRDGLAQSEQVVARDQLLAAGVRGLVRFPVRKAGSTSAPERQVLAGTFEALTV